MSIINGDWYNRGYCALQLLNSAMSKGCSLLQPECFNKVAKDVRCHYELSLREVPNYKLSELVESFYVSCKWDGKDSPFGDLCAYIEPSSAEILHVAAVATTVLGATYLAYRGCASLYNRYIKAAPVNHPEAAPANHPQPINM